MPQRLLILLALLLSGCVAAYDPSSPSRLGLESRAQEVGVKENRPWARGLRTKPSPPAVAQQPTPPPPAPAPAQATTTEPDSPAGTQLAWWLSILRGADTRRIDRHFADSFLSKVPAAQLREVSRTWRRDEFNDGPVELVKIDDDATPTALTAVIRGTATDRYTRVKLGVDDKGQISTLWLGPLVGYKRGELDTWAKLDAKCSTLPGMVSLGVFELAGTEMRPIHTLNPDTQLAIGSAFKLYILGALAEEVAAGRAKWDEPLAIKDDLKSLPSGKMQLEAEGLEFPISLFADLMISISDNTAADHLLARIGRGAAEAYMQRLNPGAARSMPFLSTMELFRIKLSPDRTLAVRYAAADITTRRNMLAPGGDVAKSIPSFAGAALWKAPYEIDRIEWFASAADCCRVMADLHRLEQTAANSPVGNSLRINPGLQFDAKMWPRIAYKGGSEPGVLNMTWLLERDDHRLYLVSFGWNDTKAEVDLKTAADLAGAAVALTAEDSRPVK